MDWVEVADSDALEALEMRVEAFMKKYWKNGNYFCCTGVRDVRVYVNGKDVRACENLLRPFGDKVRVEEFGVSLVWIKPSRRYCVIL